MVLGGAKVTDKIALIDRFLDTADVLLIGGAMCFSFFRAQGISTATRSSRRRASSWRARRSRRRRARGCRLVLPVDLVLGDSFDADTERREQDGIEVPDGWMGLDIGPRTAAAYARRSPRAGTVFWNGPMGAFELAPFAAGTRAVAEAVARRPAPRSSAAATPARRSPSSGSPTGWTTCRRAAARRSSCSRASALPGVEVLDDA